MEILHSFAEEHRLIRAVLDAFEVYVSDVEAGLADDRDDLRRFAEFFQNFAHLHHHDKEETLLFPALVRGGLDWSGEPLARVRAEHDQENYLMRALVHLAHQTDPWAKDDRLHFASVATTFIAFQRDHMRFENTEVYPHAAELSELERTRLERDVRRFDDEVRSSTDRLVALAQRLIWRHGGGGEVSSGGARSDLSRNSLDVDGRRRFGPD
jgi:hemerythrin-like domain-containing protein